MIKGNNSFPEDLIIQILSWLPLEALVKFRTVCKSWLSSIDSSKFISKHQTHFGNIHPKYNIGSNIRIIPENFPYPITPVNYSIAFASTPSIKIAIPNDKNYRIMGSCNGFFCYAHRWEDEASIHLYNPRDRRITVIPSHRLSSHPDELHNLVYGMGFDEFADDYKIVKFTAPRCESFMPEVAVVYSVNTRSWETITSTKRKRESDDYSLSTMNLYVQGKSISFAVQGKSIFLEGFVHWFAHTEYPRGSDSIIMSFDICNKVFGELPLPCYGPSREDLGFDEGPWFKGKSISVVRGLLSLLVEKFGNKRSKSPAAWYVWVMKEYVVAESWMKMYSISLQQRTMVPLELTAAGKILCHGKKSTCESQLYLYECEKCESTCIGDGYPSPDQVVSL